MVSLEALAMAGVNYEEYGMSIEELERRDLDLYPPPHLLAEEEDDESSINGVRRYTSTRQSSINEEEEFCVTFTNHEEKRKIKGRKLGKCSRSIKLMARSFGMLISLSCLIRTRD
ncbi:unnamed protein product [Vicia faba]|uniref:Uncharacterized protein n=1 Tax=Vicia faba TaxID=3906 RepID=A0AAV0ZMF2_VICFA|nr:unnamed protein product [Vicia faba]